MESSAAAGGLTPNPYEAPARQEVKKDLRKG